MRRRVRNDKGQLTVTEYTILEQPKRENPALGLPEQAYPEQGEPEQENPAQLNTKKSNTQKINTDLSNTHSFFPSAPAADRLTDGYEQREDIRYQIEYDIICTPYNREQIDEFVEIMLEVAMTRSPTIKIGRDAEYPTALQSGSVKSKPRTSKSAIPCQPCRAEAHFYFRGVEVFGSALPGGDTDGVRLICSACSPLRMDILWPPPFSASSDLLFSY